MFTQRSDEKKKRILTSVNFFRCGNRSAHLQDRHDRVTLAERVEQQVIDGCEVGIGEGARSRGRQLQ